MPRRLKTPERSPQYPFSPHSQLSSVSSLSLSLTPSPPPRTDSLSVCYRLARGIVFSVLPQRSASQSGSRASSSLDLLPSPLASFTNAIHHRCSLLTDVSVTTALPTDVSVLEKKDDRLGWHSCNGPSRK